MSEKSEPIVGQLNFQGVQGYTWSVFIVNNPDKKEVFTEFGPGTKCQQFMDESLKNCGQEERATYASMYEFVNNLANPKKNGPERADPKPEDSMPKLKEASSDESSDDEDDSVCKSNKNQ
jgi:hypothetical protein